MMSNRLRSRDPNSNTNKCYTIFFEDEKKTPRKSAGKTTSPKNKNNNNISSTINNSCKKDVCKKNLEKDLEPSETRDDQKDTIEVISCCEEKSTDVENLTGTLEENKLDGDGGSLAFYENDRKRKFDDVADDFDDNKNEDKVEGTEDEVRGLEESNNNFSENLESKKVKYDASREQMYQVIKF